MPEGLLAKSVSVQRGERAVLRSIDVSVTSGSIVGIIGPNGAGKSTLLKALVGLLPYDGEVSLNGVSLAALTPRERATRIAYVPQRSSLEAALTVETVVSHGRYAHGGGFGRFGLGDFGPDDREAIARAMERADIVDLKSRRFDQLSIGERRRVLTARALATEARVLLLDEPTAALDVRHGLQLEALLEELRSDGYAIAVVLHALDAVRRLTQRAILLADGETVAEGPSEEVVSEETIREVYGVELIERGSLGFRLRGAL